MKDTTQSAASSLDGRRGRDEAHRLLVTHRAVWILLAQRALLLAALENETATADDIHNRVTLPDSIHPSCFGPAPRILSRAGLIVSVGMRRSKRKETHCRKVEVWRVVDRDAALAWLAANPEPLLPSEPDARPAKQLDLMFDEGGQR